MISLPVIVGFGGIGPAGRSSAHHAYRRLIIDKLHPQKALETYTDLALLMGLVINDNGALVDKEGTKHTKDSIEVNFGEYIRNNTLIRRLENNLFDKETIPLNRSATLKASSEDSKIIFNLREKHLPSEVPAHWIVKKNGAGTVKVIIEDSMDVFLPDSRVSKVQSAGQLPTGFNPESLYQSRNHPRGLQMTIYGASDAIQSMGIDWSVVSDHVSPDQIGVYSGSGMSQLDYAGNGGMLQAHLIGKRPTSKQLPLGLPEMPADFINAYIIGSVGTTGCNIGACATFLYNLRQAIWDIQSGRRRVVIVGNSEAPITPEIIEGYRTMGALAEDERLMALDQGRSEPDYQRASRPFSLNCGFTLSESAQYIVLFDDALAMELGANIYGSVADVFVNADGHKKSIPGPGVGNYITMAKATALTKTIIGEEGLRRRSFVQAHGTSTPQNRVTESHILNEVARSNGIENWTIAAVKSYLGHSLSAASADQLIASLGVWKYGYIPGIVTVDDLADDIFDSNLRFILEHDEVGTEGMDAVLMNAKGFGGNNATGSIIAPHITREILKRRYGVHRMTEYEKENEKVAETTAEYDSKVLSGKSGPIYKFDHNVVVGEDLIITKDELKIPGYKNAISLKMNNPYQ